ncbi:MAG: glycogen/starch synthase [Bacteroidia bacterium]|nr:glycogen/starch synthase [Bacteroidia bacterium]
MDKYRVLFVTQELQPYTALSEISEIVSKLPKYAHDQGMEIRILMPRFGTINERRHRLHEVVRLSGMNIIVDDDDFPLIIKVASLPGSRMQVYFLDNEDFFKRKSVFEDSKGELFEDNEDRMIFFCKGVIETVKKFGWAPNIIHCHGWMTSLVPVYLKTAYKNEPIFQKSKVIYSMYDNDLSANFTDRFIEKASINNLEKEDLASYSNGTAITLHHGASQYTDVLVQGGEVSENLGELYESFEKIKIKHEDGEYAPAYQELYNSLVEE